jgi:hypothetical protein
MAELPVFKDRVAEATAGERWIVDGSYTKVRDVIWPRADTVVWLDYPLPVVLTRLFRRTATRWLTRQELWNGNRERLRDNFTRDSLFLWAYRQQRRHRTEYPRSLAFPAHAHLKLVHLRSPGDAARWLEKVDEPAPAPNRTEQSSPREDAVDRP